MTLLARVLVVVALACSSAAEESADVSLLLSPAEVPLKVGAPLQLDCGVEGPFRHCFWETADGSIVQVEDVHAGLHEGLSAPQSLAGNQCGLVVEQASKAHLGDWTCRVLQEGQALKGTLRTVRACDYPFVAVGTECYYFSESLLMTWTEARSFCQTLAPGADLAVLDDCYQFQVVWGHILVNYAVSVHWIGAQDTDFDGRYFWVDDTLMEMGTPFWKPGYPTGTDGCVALGDAGGYYIDSPCTNDWRFVCQQLVVS